MLRFQIVTARPIPSQLLIREVEKTAKKTAKFIDKEFKKSYKTWTNKPKFKRTVRKSGSRITAKVVTTNKIYGFVNSGTRVRRARMIPPFRAKTRVGQLKSRRGTFSGVVVSRRFNLPGIKARNFDVLVLNNTNKYVRKELRKLRSRILRRL